jgi:hypothetical protein
MYHILAADLEPASPGYVYINSNNWKENLGQMELVLPLISIRPMGYLLMLIIFKTGCIGTLSISSIAR